MRAQLPGRLDAGKTSEMTARFLYDEHGYYRAEIADRGITENARALAAALAHRYSVYEEIVAALAEVRVWLDVWGQENENCSAKARELEGRVRAALDAAKDRP